MSIRLRFNCRLTLLEQQLCQDYWAFNNNSGYIRHVNTLCKQYDMTPSELFGIIEKCYVCLDEVSCEHCGYFCPIEVPADIPYMRLKEFWLCEDCVRIPKEQVLIGR